MNIYEAFNKQSALMEYPQKFYRAATDALIEVREEAVVEIPENQHIDLLIIEAVALFNCIKQLIPNLAANLTIKKAILAYFINELRKMQK